MSRVHRLAGDDHPGSELQVGSGRRFPERDFQDAGFSHGAWAAACCDNFPGTRALSPAHRIEQEPHGHHCIPCLRRSESLPQGRK